MKNLAGNNKCDEFIEVELKKAGIEVVNVIPARTEVPYSIVGKLGDWTFTRAWYYWMARAERGKGLPLDIAISMHEKPFPIQYFDDYYEESEYGMDIRCEGHAGSPNPREYCANQATVDSYHVDNQEGLNELARTINMVELLKQNL